MGKEIDSVIKNLPTQEISGPDASTGRFYQTFQEESTPVLLKLFQKIEEEGTFPNSFYEASFTLVAEPDDTTRKQNYRSISLIISIQKFSTKY